jgi:hypothetical protein
MMIRAQGGGPAEPVPPGRPVRVPHGQGEHVPDVPAGVVVGEDRRPESGRPARHAVGAQHPGRREDRVGGVVGGQPDGSVGPDGVFGERGGLELHRPLRALVVLAAVHAAGPGLAVVRFHRADPREHLPGQPGAGPGGVPVQGQVPGGDGGRRSRLDHHHEHHAEQPGEQAGDG